mgnify:CR=1 FL=1
MWPEHTQNRNALSIDEFYSHLRYSQGKLEVTGKAMSLSENCQQQHKKESALTRRMISLGAVGATGLHLVMLPLVGGLPAQLALQPTEERIELFVTPLDESAPVEELPEPLPELTEPQLDSSAATSDTVAAAPATIQAIPVPTEPEPLPDFSNGEVDVPESEESEPEESEPEESEPEESEPEESEPESQNALETETEEDPDTQTQSDLPEDDTSETESEESSEPLEENSDDTEQATETDEDEFQVSSNGVEDESGPSPVGRFRDLLGRLRGNSEDGTDEEDSGTSPVAAGNTEQDGNVSRTTSSSNAAGRPAGRSTAGNDGDDDSGPVAARSINSTGNAGGSGGSRRIPPVCLG